MVIPALAESAHLFATLRSLAANPSELLARFLVLVVVNHREDGVPGYKQDNYETLKRLALRRIPPTPDNYRSLYHEIAGTQVAEAFPEKALKALANALPRTTPEQMRYYRQIDAAIGEANWEALKTALVELMNKSAAPAANWGVLIRDLLSQY